MERQKILALIIISIVIGGTIPVAGSALPEYLILSILVLFLYGILLLIFHWLYNLLNWIDPTVMFVVSYVVFIGIGIVMTGYYGIELAPSVLIALAVGLTMFLIGALTSDILASPSGRIKIRQSVIVVSNFHRNEVTWAWMFFFIGVFFLVYYYYQVGTIPFLAENAEDVRIVVKSGRGYLPIAGHSLISISTTFLIAAHVKQNHLHLFFVILAVVISVILILGVGYRTLSVRILLSGFIVYSFVRKSKISGVALIFLIALFFVLLSITGFYRLFGHSIQSLEQVEFAFRRSSYAIFVRYLWIFNLVMAYFPNIHPFMLGQSYLISASTMMPGPQLHFGFWLVENLGLVLSSSGPVDPTILGEFYANFGWIGIMVGMFMLGAGLRTLYRFLKIGPSLSIARLVLMVLLSTSIMDVVASGLVLVLLFNSLPIVAVFIAYRVCVRMSILRPTHISVKSILVKS